jgi:hypothetical protein
MLAAVRDTSPEPVSPADALLFDRERSLGMTPLEDAFESLLVAVPELKSLMDRVVKVADVGVQRERDEVANSEIWSRVVRLVGPEAKHPDPLVRSQVAKQVVASYFKSLEGCSSARDGRHSVFDPNRRGNRTES